MNLTILQTAFPAFQVTVNLHIMSVRTLISPTDRSESIIKISSSNGIKFLLFANSVSITIKPANAKCIMKKFILDLLALLKRSAKSTAELPSTIAAKSSHNTVNCSVYK
jgi:hypothetical protein